MIPVDKCKPGYLYLLNARNLRIGVWNPELQANKGAFIGIRDKFRQQFLDRELHYDADPRYGTATPLVELEVCPIELINEDRGTRCSNCGTRVNYEYHKDGLKHEYPGTWVHLAQTVCNEVEPITDHNDELFDWLALKLIQYDKEIEAGRL